MDGNEKRKKKEKKKKEWQRATPEGVGEKNKRGMKKCVE